LGSQKIVIAFEEDNLNQPPISEHVEEGDGEIRMLQRNGERVGSEAFVGPLMDAPHAPGLLVEPLTALPAVSQGEENNGLDTKYEQTRLEGVWESGPVLSPIGSGPVPFFGPQNKASSSNLFSGTSLCLEGVQKANKHVYFRSEDFDFSKFSDSFGALQEESEKLLRAQQKQRQRRRKGKADEKAVGGKPKRRPLEVTTLDKKGGSRK